LIYWCFTARQHKIDQFVPIYQGGLLAQAFEDSQLRIANEEHTKHIDTMNIHMQRQTIGMPYMLKDKQCIPQITRPKMGKKRTFSIND